ncbi:hypothetical protein C8R43DRAFT_1074895, partial [Mycena crocata]
MKDGRASFAVWWGDGNKKNGGHIVDGKSSNARACILAVLCAARDSPPEKNLIIYTSSEYIIRSFCFWAGDNETQGWSCANGKDISIAVEWLARRRAPTEFRWIPAASSAAPYLQTKRRAKEVLGADSQLRPTFKYDRPSPRVENDNIEPLTDVIKVTTLLREVPEAKDIILPEVDVEDIIDPDINHRGRRRERELMHDNLLKLLACQGKSSKDFWNLVRGWTDNKPTKPRVTIDQLHDSFKARLNPPDEFPAEFDADLHEIVNSLNNTIPK